MAMLMGICYLMNPLREPIHKFLHGISHSLEAPTTLISHSTISNSEHKSLDHYDSYQHQMNHDHGLIDFITTIFEASNENHNSDESLLKEIKIDKHITTEQISFKPPLLTKTRQSYHIPLGKVYPDYFQKLIKPPQSQIA